MLLEHRKQHSQSVFIHCRGQTKQRESSEDVHRPQGNFHCAGPICSAPDWVLFVPVCKLVEELFSKNLVLCYRVGSSQCNEVAQPIEFPQHSYVRSIVVPNGDVGVK